MKNGATIFQQIYKHTKITTKSVSLLYVGKDGGLYINKVCYDGCKLTAQK